MTDETNSNTYSASEDASQLNYDDLIKPTDLAREYPDLFSDAKIRWLIRQRDHNGLSKAGAIIKCGRTILIVRPKFLGWLLANKA